jgi:Ecdysteroid kinase-like family
MRFSHFKLFALGASMGLSKNIIVDENGNCSSLPSETFEIALKEIVTKKLGDINKFTIVCSAGSGKGDNYLGIVCRIQVKNKSDGKVQMSLVLKSAPQNADRRDQFYIHEVYGREINFYTEIYPLYEKFQREKGIDVEADGFRHVAKCYQAFGEEPFEGIIFEDLKFNGFEMFDRHKKLTREHVILTMKALAKMHAVGYAIKDQKPELIEKYKTMPDLLIKICADENSSIRIWIETQAKLAATVLDKCQNEEIKKRIKKILDTDFIAQFEEVIDGRLAEPYANICHGDVSESK